MHDQQTVTTYPIGGCCLPCLQMKVMMSLHSVLSGWSWMLTSQRSTTVSRPRKSLALPLKTDCKALLRSWHVNLSPPLAELVALKA